MARTEPKFDPHIVEAEEDLLIDFQFLVQDIIDSKRMSRTELAKRAGITKARLSQILSAEANPTVRTFARLFHALDKKVRLRATPDQRETIVPASADIRGDWHVDKAIAPEIAEMRAAKVRARDEWWGASNDNYVAIESDATSFSLKAAA